MGKPTGFLDYDRQDNPCLSCKERTCNFDEFHPPLDENARRLQGARCMDCGVPFCQSAIELGGMVTGCPLHNLIPEWNDEIYNGNFAHALSRLTKTASFPEFTGRVCPALCEKACVCLQHGDSVTIRENELFLIEYGFENGLVTARTPKTRTGKRVAVIGSGPAGLAVADMLNRRGHNVCVFERDDRGGGLLTYGIPNMKLDKKIVERRVQLMRDEGVEFVLNCNVTGAKAEEIYNTFDATVLCCGAKQPRALPGVDMSVSGVYYAVDFLSDVTRHVLDGVKIADVKDKKVVIVGGGDTGNDCVASCVRLGAQSVVQLEMMPCPPTERRPDNPWPQWPKVKKTDYGQLEAIELYGADPREFETTVDSLMVNDGRLYGVNTSRVSFKDRVMTRVDGSEKSIPCDILLIAAGFTGCEGYAPQAFCADVDSRGRVETKNGYAASRSGLFCAGDMRRGQSLVVWAIAEGRACAKQVDEFLMGYSNM